ncbi:MAG TPA: MarR family transcriptional regulator [Candidatus Baltobacteraceae bacterium]|nr:MarR family transcriptional regulator [Candidatus Baltobacteraceae bacterium]
MNRFLQRPRCIPSWTKRALRRSGPPFQLSPTELYHEMMLTSGMMNRVDRLEEAGLVTRRPDPDDRRGTLVRLTAKGKAPIDSATSRHVANEERLLASLSSRERQRLKRTAAQAVD